MRSRINPREGLQRQADIVNHGKGGRKVQVIPSEKFRSKRNGSKTRKMFAGLGAMLGIAGIIAWAKRKPDKQPGALSSLMGRVKGLDFLSSFMRERRSIGA